MFKRALLLQLLICLGLSNAWAKGDDLLVVSYFPKQGVYHKDTLLDLVTKTERLLAIRDNKSEPLFQSIDSLSTENIIVPQGDEVRFRRLVEKREMTQDGLSTLKALVNSHPLLHDKLADPQGNQLHLWLRLNQSLSSNTYQRVFDQVMSVLGENQQCQRKLNTGALDQTTYEEWSLTSHHHDVSDLYQRLLALTQSTQKQALVAYSATDLIGYLKQSMMQQPVNVGDSSEIEQLYMIAESVRSRHLHDLATPSFKKLKLVRMQQGELSEMDTSFFESQLIRQWKASEQTYQVLDCRQST